MLLLTHPTTPASTQFSARFVLILERDERLIREKVRADRFLIARVIDTVATSRLPNVRTMHRRPEGDHVLMHHPAHQRIAS